MGQDIFRIAIVLIVDCVTPTTVLAIEEYPWCRLDGMYVFQSLSLCKDCRWRDTK